MAPMSACNSAPLLWPMPCTARSSGTKNLCSDPLSASTHPLNFYAHMTHTDLLRTHDDLMPAAAKSPRTSSTSAYACMLLNRSSSKDHRRLPGLLSKSMSHKQRSSSTRNPCTRPPMPPCICQISNAYECLIPKAPSDRITLRDHWFIAVADAHTARASPEPKIPAPEKE